MHWYNDDPQQPGILNVIRDGLDCASNTLDYYIQEADLTLAEVEHSPCPFIHPTTKETVIALIDQYVSHKMTPIESEFKLADLFIRHDLSAPLKQFLHDLKRLGIYIPSNHVMPESEAEGYPLLTEHAFWTVQLKNGIPAKALGDASLRELYFTPARVLTNDARARLRTLKDLSIVRPAIQKYHEADPRRPMLQPLKDEQVVRMQAGNLKCCLNGKCTTDLAQMADYCEEIEGQCNALSDPC